ncbi:chitinase [Rathayibacter sp. YIM 133350]|uniref:chitinase n=1 Tax=Rathayibacter sp. YIM 133350 TaxID=3131992 RepID=UPI00307D3D96
MKRVSLSLGIGAVLAAASLLAAVAPASAADSAPTASVSPISTPKLLPLHFSAPFVDVTSVGSIADVAKQSGAKYLTLAFLQTEKPGSCDLYWAGNVNAPVSADIFGDDINAIRAAGGDVIPSFGGYAADTTNTEIADSCTDVHKIALAYEKVITTYKVQRLDFDIEVDAISNTAGIDRRNKAIHELQGWALKNRIPLTIAYTLPSTPQGLGATGVALLQSAADNHAYIGAVNIMTFDYWDGQTHDMVADAKTAAAGLVNQMKATIDPYIPRALLWFKVGIIQMNGIDDFGPQETFSPAEAAPFITWAKSKHLNFVSFWAIERDNGGCPGVKGAWNCSGVVQEPWAFTHAFSTFTGWWI